MASSSSTTATTSLVGPKILKDPRFRAGRKLIESGRDGAIDIFGTLLEEARNKYGEASIETAPAYFEYGNALFRESQRQLEQQQEQDDDEEEGDATVESGETDGDKKPAAVPKEEENDDTPEQGGASHNQKEEKDDNQGDDHGIQPEEAEAEHDKAAEEEEEEEDDAHLALAMMETAFAVLDNYVQSAAHVNDADAAYLPWAQRESLPRYLTNIGDVLSYLERHADAADAYTRELQCREDNLNVYETITEQQGKDPNLSLQELKDRRKVAEANVLVAEELLACPPGHDVVTTETQSVLVEASELITYATGYYEKARDQLQETVFLMGKIAAAQQGNKSVDDKEAFQAEKENICFASTLLMAVGEKLAEHGEQQTAAAAEPAKKKAKK